jgi:hypothetical protein
MGSFVIQLAQLLAILWNVEVPVISAQSGASSDALESKLNFLYWQMIGTHSVCALVQYLSHMPKQEHPFYLTVANLMGVVLQIFNTVTILHYLFVMDAPVTPTQEYFEFELWLITETIIFFIGIAAHVLFLLLRAFFRSQVDFDDGIMNNESDFLESQSTLSGTFVSFAVQYPVLLFVREFCRFEALKDSTLAVEAKILPMTLFQLLTFPLLIFINFVEPPFQFTEVLFSWIGIAPKIFGIIAIVDYVVIPIANAALFIADYRNVINSNFTGQIAFCFYCSVLIAFIYGPVCFRKVMMMRNDISVAKSRATRAQIGSQENWDELKQKEEVAEQIRSSVVSIREKQHFILRNTNPRS